jgi:hypothetical protein
LGFGGPRLVARPAALIERDQAPDNRDGQQAGDRGEHQAQAALRPPRGRPARVEEGALGLVELLLVCGPPLQRGGQPRAAIDVPRIAAVLVPVTRGRGQVDVYATADPVFLEPRAVSRPFPQQRLVRELDLPVAERQQASVRQRCENRARTVDALELAPWHSAAGQRSILAAGEPQHDAARDPSLGVAQLGVGGFRQAGDRAAHATARPVAVVAQHAPVTRPPQLEQRRREQRQSPGLTDHVGHEGVGQPALDLEPRARGRLLDRPRQLVAMHRPNQGVATAQQLREARIGSEAAVEIGAQRHDYLRAPLGIARCRRQLLDERRALVLLLAQGEQLLQLVDRDDEPPTGRKLSEHVTEPLAVEGAPKLGTRMGARPEQHLAPFVAARQATGAQGGQHTGAQQRGFPDPRRTEDPHQRRFDQPRQQVRNKALATAEVVRVGAIEEGKPLEWTDPRRDTAGQPRADGVQGGVLLQNRALELLQHSGWLEPQLLPQQLTRLAIDRQRVRLPAGAIEREHELPTQPLLQWAGGDQRFDLGNQLTIASER